MDEYSEEIKKRGNVPKSFVNYTTRRLNELGVDPQEVDIEAFYDPGQSEVENNRMFDRAYPTPYGKGMSSTEIKEIEAQNRRYNAEESAKEQQERARISKELVSRERAIQYTPSELDKEIEGVEALEREERIAGKRAVAFELSRKDMPSELDKTISEVENQKPNIIEKLTGSWKKHNFISKKKEELKTKKEIEELEAELTRKKDRDKLAKLKMLTSRQGSAGGGRHRLGGNGGDQLPTLLPPSSQNPLMRKSTEPKWWERKATNRVLPAENPLMRKSTEPKWYERKPTNQTLPSRNPLMRGSGQPKWAQLTPTGARAPKKKYHYRTVYEKGEMRREKVYEKDPNQPTYPGTNTQPQPPKWTYLTGNAGKNKNILGSGKKRPRKWI